MRDRSLYSGLGPCRVLRHFTEVAKTGTQDPLRYIRNFDQVNRDYKDHTRGPIQHGPCLKAVLWSIHHHISLKSLQGPVGMKPWWMDFFFEGGCSQNQKIPLSMSFFTTLTIRNWCQRYPGCT